MNSYHMVALRKRFHGRDDLCERAHAWVRAVNLDTLELLEEVVELSASGTGKIDATGNRAQGARATHSESVCVGRVANKDQAGRVSVAGSYDFCDEYAAIAIQSPGCRSRAGERSTGKSTDRRGNGAARTGPATTGGWQSGKMLLAQRDCHRPGRGRGAKRDDYD